ncbi:dTDP-4-amino-4,6-dideoxygalactose transaminase [Marmoricola sp. URHB0036]|uniref:dTDP-4-amino-4,6-dideoxygalactose transaminase n=1 Tax=Marmoricola sp. URHB0036 TaxID=1298863 RepID=UPI0018CA1E4B|nr:dTDP-4-amino-4,6-dideoxygalactose transaminase [Marmoricola sp. URHB0036]
MTEAEGRGRPVELPEIPFNVAAVAGRELEYIQQAIQGGHPASGGEFTRRAAQVLAEHTGAAEVLMTTSCTSALELSAMLLDLQPDDTVIVPSFTFTSTALAFARQGAGLVFCDIEPRTLSVDPQHLASLLDEHVRAVVVVHYAGVACDMEGIQEVLAAWPEVRLIEDNAHGLFGSWRGRPLGSLGRYAALSFHETKNFVCGEGGALVLNDPVDVDRARVLYDKGTNRRAFMLGQVDKYTWKDTGSSFGLSDVLAAYLLAQLEERDTIQAKRRTIHDHYSAALAPYAEELDFQLMQVPEGRESAYHMFYVLLPGRDRRNDSLEMLRKLGVQATFHYLPLHTSDAGRAFSVRETECPVSEQVSDRLLRLPFYNDLSEHDVDRVVAAFLDTASATLRDR